MHTHAHKQNVVVIGGGTGTFTALSGLKKYRDQINLKAVVTMADSGGSTGRLRDEFGYLPVGDVRMALTALASEDDAHEGLLRELFLHRFDKGNGLSGHNVGNLLLIALTDILKDEAAAIRAAGKVLRVCGEVLPVSTDQTHLVATYDDSVVVIGEHTIDEPHENRRGHRVAALTLTQPAHITPDAAQAIEDADLVVLGPGDLYTSLLANCVIKGVSESLKRTRGRVAYVGNLMTKVGQTEGMTLADHVFEIEQYIDRTLDQIYVNTAPLPSDLLERYAAEGEVPVTFALDDEHASRYITGDFLMREMVVTRSGDVLRRSLIRHDSEKLAHALIQHALAPLPVGV